MTTQRPRGLDAGRRAYEAQRNRRRTPEPEPVVTDLRSLANESSRHELGRTRYAAQRGDEEAQAALRIFDVQRDAEIRARYRGEPLEDHEPLSDETLAGIARATLADIEERRKNVSPSPDAS